MTLPVLSSPIYNLEVPSTKQKAKYRPFTVKEEKIFLIAIQDDTKEATTGAIKQVIQNCTFNVLDVDKLATYDLEYVFLQLYMKSKGATKELSFECKKHGKQIRDILTKNPDGTTERKFEEYDGPCGCVNKFNLDLATVKLESNEKHNHKIMLTDNIGLIMRPPTIDDASKMGALMETDDVNEIYKAMNPFITAVFKDNQIFNDFTQDELVEFIESMDDAQFQKMKDYFETMPKLRAKLDLVCSKCGNKEELRLEGLQSFLA